MSLEIFVISSHGRFELLLEQIVSIKSTGTNPNVTIIHDYLDNRLRNLDVSLIYTNARRQFEKANIALQACESKWLIITHDDDLLLSGSSQKILEKNSHFKGPLIVPLAHAFGEGAEDWNFDHKSVFSRFVDSHVENFCLDSFKYGNPIAFPGVLINREAALKAGSFNEMLTYSGDFEFWLRLSKFGNFKYVHDVNLHYRLHSGQVSSNHGSDARIEFRLIRNAYSKSSKLNLDFCIDTLKSLIILLTFCLRWDLKKLDRFRRIRKRLENDANRSDSSLLR
jgi:hypothetical protein